MSDRELSREIAVALGIDTRDLAEATVHLKRDQLPTVKAVYYVRHRDSIVSDDGGITTRVARLKLVAQPDEGAPT